MCSQSDGGASGSQVAAALEHADARTSAGESEPGTELAELRRRERFYRGGRPAIPIAGLTTILVDDGSANAAVLRLALGRLRHARPRRVVLALPLVQREVLRAIEAEADESIRLFEVADGAAARASYGDRGELSDAEVAGLLERGAGPHA